MKRIGFIGLGVMGKPMALNLVKAGYALRVYDHNLPNMEVLAARGAEIASSAKEAAWGMEAVITMLPDSFHVKTAVMGEDGVLQGASQGAILVDMSSISPLAAREISKAAAERGVAMLDAPVSGGEPKAVDGSLAIMVGGPAEAFEKVKDALLVMGASATLLGGTGSGSTTKLANQIIVALNLAAMSEAMVLAAKAGVEPEKVFRAIRGGLAGSTVLDAKMPLVLAGDFKPGGRIELHLKDMMNALDTAHELGVPLPLSSQVAEIMQALKVDGKAGDDHGGLIQFYEKLAKVQVRG